MDDQFSSQAAELNPDHCDIDPRFGTGFGGFVIAHESPVVHQPTEGPFYDPTAWQDAETGGGIRAFDDLDRQLGAKSLDPVGEGLAGVTAIDPQNTQPSKPAQHARQKQPHLMGYRTASIIHRRSLGRHPRLAGLGSKGLRQAQWASVKTMWICARFQLTEHRFCAATPKQPAAMPPYFN